jgi:hypothetical protein
MWSKPAVPLVKIWGRRAFGPRVPLRFFRDRAVSAASVTSPLMSFGVLGSIFLRAQFFQVVRGHMPLRAGLRTLSRTAMPIIIARIACVPSDRIGARMSLCCAPVANLAPGTVRRKEERMAGRGNTAREVVRVSRPHPVGAIASRAD